MTLRGMVPRGGCSPLRSSISPRTKSFLIKKVSVLSPSNSSKCLDRVRQRRRYEKIVDIDGDTYTWTPGIFLANIENFEISRNRKNLQDNEIEKK